MAKEAVLKIKEAEEKAAETVRGAHEKARQTLIAAEKEAAAKCRTLIQEAGGEKDAILREAVKSAEAECGPLDAEGGVRAEKIKNPEREKYEKAVAAVTERIVNQFGHS